MARKRAGQYAGKYDPADFVIPSVDNNGHTEKLWLKIQPGYLHDIGTVVGSGRFPWADVQSFMRWAVDVGLKEAHRMEPEVTNHLPILEAVNRLVVSSQMSREFSKSIEAVQKEVYENIAVGAKEEAARLVILILQQAYRLPSGFWRTKYVNEIKKNFGYLIKSAGKRVSLEPDYSTELAWELDADDKTEYPRTN